MIWISLLLLCLIVSLAGYGIARLISKRTQLDIADHILFSFPLGTAIIGWIEFVFSEFIGLPITATLLYSLSGLLALIGGVYVSIDIKQYKGFKLPQWTPFAWFAFCLIGLLFVRQCLESFTEPFVGLDALRYHFPFAHVIYKTHALPQFVSPGMADLFFTNPPLHFLWYANIWLWLGEAHLFLPIYTTIIYGVLICILIYRMARSVFQVSSELALALILCLWLPGIFSIVLKILRSTTDLPFAFWGVAVAYWWLRDGIDQTDKRWIWLAISGGLTAWFKPYGYVLGLAYVGVMAGWWLYARNQEVDWTYTSRVLFKTWIVWAVVVLPIPLQHWILWGNPVYPVAHELFGGILINAWSLERSIMLLDIFAWDGHNIIRQVLSEPLAALGIIGVFSATIYRHPVHRLAGVIGLVYISLYILLFSRTLTNFVIGAHVRYLMPGILLLGFNSLSFLSQPSAGEKGHRRMLLLVGLAIQGGLIAAAFFLQPAPLNAMLSLGIAGIYILLNEWMSFFLILGFIILIFFDERVTSYLRPRLILLSLSCLFLTYAWPLTAPWQYITQPLQSPALNWSQVGMISSYGRWMAENLSQSAVVLMDEDQRWLIPRQILPADSPLCEKIYATDISLEDKMHTLADLGVTHIAVTGTDGRLSPLTTGGLIDRPGWAFFAEAEGRSYFEHVYTSLPAAEKNDQEGQTNTATYFFRIHYPTDLQDILASPLKRPWLYGFGTNPMMDRAK